jgi:hypothetical protein
VAAVVLLPVVLLVVFRSAPTPSDVEQKVLDRLAVYGVRPELDEENRVVRLVLEGKQVTDEALDEVGCLPHLKKLSLHNSSVTDAGMLKVRQCRRLQNLGVTNTYVTDRGLGYVAQMPSLRNVWVCETDKLTPRGIASLRRVLPGVKVHVMNQAGKDSSAEKGKAKGDKKSF